MKSTTILVKFEFLGTANAVTGIESFELMIDRQSVPLWECFAELSERFPSVNRVFNLSRRTMEKGYLVSINGQRFVSDLTTSINSSCEVFILATDIGG
jgi:hypothetical protein